MDLIELAKQLIEIPSVIDSGDEIKKCMKYCRDYFSSNKNIFIKEIENNGKPSILLANVDGLNFDIVSLGHIDVIPVENKDMFKPVIENGKLYGRGSIDMKSQVAISMRMLKYVLENNLKIDFGIIIVSDEETGGENCAKYWTEDLKLKAKILLDFDNGGDIDSIIYKLKGLFRVKLHSTGLSAHSSQPWYGVSANDNLMLTLMNLRKYFPYFSNDNVPKDEWLTTMQIGMLSGGSSINTISPEADAYLDFRLTEEYNYDDILEIIKKCSIGDIRVNVISRSMPVNTNCDNEYLNRYKKIAENVIGSNIKFSTKNWATDSRYFVSDYTTIISHGPSGYGPHTANEWADVKSLENFEKIQIEFLKDMAKVFR